MTEIEMRINTITHILATEPSKIGKMAKSLQALHGLDFTHLNNKKKNSIYKHMTDYNKIMEKYPTIKTQDDYHLISDIDLSKILKSIQQLCIKLLID